MLKGLFGTKKSILPPPPKNQIEVACPACGAAQYEPRLVVSTFCRSCGTHLTIHKRKVTASSVTRSGAVGMNDLWETPAPAETAPAAQAAAPELPAESTAAPSAPPELTAAIDSPPEAQPPPATGLDPIDAAQAGFGAFLQASSKAPPVSVSSPTPAPEDSTHPTLRKLATPLAARPGPALPSSATIKKGPSTPVPPPNSTLEKMRSQSSFRQQHFKSIECFDCGHKLKVSRSSKSAQCSECGAAICCEDLDINTQVIQPIRTRGDVTVRKVGSITTSLVECRELNCFGIIEAEIICDHDAKFRTEGTIVGPVKCRKLIIEKGADVHFTHTVHADEMFINSRTTGNLNAAGKVVIGPYGSLNGDVTAHAVAMEPGGELNGGMNIVRAAPRPAPPPSDDEEEAPPEA